VNLDREPIERIVTIPTAGIRTMVGFRVFGSTPLSHVTATLNQLAPAHW
jgi:hypothetical protein